MKIGLAQLNPTVGAIDANARKIRQAAEMHPAADLLVFPELMLSGYPPEDLVLRPSFLAQIEQAVTHYLAPTTASGPALLVGSPWRYENHTYNAALLLANGKIQHITAKQQLPNYGVFDEQRVFTAGGWPRAMSFQGKRLGVLICEDLWHAGGARALQQDGADLLICINGSPYEQGKLRQRLDIATSRVRETSLPLIYVNMVGGQDELVFDGFSFTLHASGQPAMALPQWEEAIEVQEWR